MPIDLDAGTAGRAGEGVWPRSPPDTARNPPCVSPRPWEARARTAPGVQGGREEGYAGRGEVAREMQPGDEGCGCERRCGWRRSSPRPWKAWQGVPLAVCFDSNVP